VCKGPTSHAPTSAGDLDHVGHPAAAGAVGDHHHQLDGVGDQVGLGAVDGGAAAGVAGLQGVGEVDGGLVADLADDDAVGGGAEGGFHQVAEADAVGGAQGQVVAGGELELDGVLEDDDAVEGSRRR
jgi:hypothetical protein